MHLTAKLRLKKLHSIEERNKVICAELFEDELFNDISFGAKRDKENTSKLHVSKFKFFKDFMKGK